MTLYDDFQQGINPAWQVDEIGQGHVQPEAGALHLTLPAQDASSYSDAQITDYNPAQRAFSLRPPLRLSVTASSALPAEQLSGTAGFGFWNHPFVPGERGLRVPQALWFFYASPPNDMALAHGIPGHGWKAACFNAQRWQFFALLPTAPLAIPLMHWRAAYHALWPIGQAALGVQEAALDAGLLQQPQRYRLEWLRGRARFFVNDALVLDATTGIPTKPLGFIAWLDNQYAIVTPQGRFGSGFVPVPQPQALVLHEVRIETLR